MNISNLDKENIKNLITESETRTDGEIVPMIIDHSDIYPVAHFRAAIIVSFLFSLILYYSPLTVINPIYFLWIQLPGLYVGYFLGHYPLIKKLMLTKDEIDREVTQRAHEAFLQHNLHTTKNHNGVLIFISIMERKIKIIADVGISKKVEQTVWDEIVFQFTQKVREDKFVEGLKETITATANVLENYFPSSGKKPNELGDNLIIED